MRQSPHVQDNGSGGFEPSKGFLISRLAAHHASASERRYDQREHCFRIDFTRNFSVIGVDGSVQDRASACNRIGNRDGIGITLMLWLLRHWKWRWVAVIRHLTEIGLLSETTPMKRSLALGLLLGLRAGQDLPTLARR